ncbi:MAG: hypothetical protein ACE5I5_18230 [Candidatus Heimdallarchaeota archaeon]
MVYTDPVGNGGWHPENKLGPCRSVERDERQFQPANQIFRLS